MRKLRMVFSSFVLVFLLFGQFQPAFAGAVTQYRVGVKNVTIPWLFPLESLCSEIPEGVIINPDDLGSNRVKKATQRVMPDGSTQIVINDLIKGTATDNFGVTYQFIYVNLSTYKYDGSTVFVTMKDTFKLKGGDVNYTAGLNWRWAYPAPNLGVVEYNDENGETVDIAANPFFFPTHDGVTEALEIVPGSWQQLSTRGDPFNCDPI